MIRQGEYGDDLTGHPHGDPQRIDLTRRRRVADELRVQVIHLLGRNAKRVRSLSTRMRHVGETIREQCPVW